MPYEKSKSNNSFPYTPYRSCMVGLCVVWNRTEVFLYDFAAFACNVDGFIEKQGKGSSDKLELALEVLALLAMVYFTVFMLLPF